MPAFLGTTTIPEHHSVGSSTREITPRLSILSNSSLTLVRSGSDTVRAVCNAYGRASGFNFISYSRLNVPSPSNKEGYRSIIAGSI